MANYKRKKSKRSVKCTMCTTNRWKGNSKKAERFSRKSYQTKPEKTELKNAKLRSK